MVPQEGILEGRRLSAGGENGPALVLYSDGVGLDDHRVRLTLAEKGLSASVERVDPAAPPPVLESYGARGELPVLRDRDLALYGVQVIVDYLDERYPHPPLMPTDPLGRARTRFALYRMERDWHALAPSRGRRTEDEHERVERLATELAASNELFAAMPFFLGESWSVLDAALVPLLWRLPHYGIVLPESAGAVADYARRMFLRPAFRASLSPEEREMSPP